MWERDVGKDWVSSQHQSVGQQISKDPLEKGSFLVDSLNTIRELENCLKKLDRGIFRKRRSWATQQKAEGNKLELRSHLGRTWEKLL